MTRPLVERFAALHAAGDTAGIGALLAPNAVMQTTLSALDATGAREVEELLATTLQLWGDRHETVVAVLADAESGGVESTVRGTTAAGALTEVGVVTALGLADGQIASIRVYCDTTPFRA